MDWYGIIKDFAAPTVALIGVGVTGGIALAGLKTFDRWRPEKLEEKRIDVAIEALAIAFEASIVFNDIRSRIMTVHKYADTKTAEDDQPGEQEGSASSWNASKPTSRFSTRRWPWSRNS